MDDVWFGSNLTHRDVEPILQSLSLQGNRLPLIAVADGGLKLVLASRALFRFFQVNDGDALAERLLASRDPGARRLAALCKNMTLNGAPRLERLRFFIYPASEVVTFLCRRILKDDQPLFVAAALGLRLDQNTPDRPTRSTDASKPVPTPLVAIEPMPIDTDADQPDADRQPPGALPGEADRPQGRSIEAIQSLLRARWPSGPTTRFLWQTNSDLVFTQITPPLADVVGTRSAGLVGTSFVELAPKLDPSGRLAEALSSRANWSGLDVSWPIADSPAAVAVCLGGVPAFDRDRTFEGFRGYGVIRLDQIQSNGGRALAGSAADEEAVPGRVVAFPGGASKALSREENATFEALGAELRDHVANGQGLAAEPEPIAMPNEPAATLPGSGPPETSHPDETPSLAPDAAVPLPVEPSAAEVAASGTEASAASADKEASAEHDRAADIARNGLTLLDRLAVAVLVSRDGVPIFANRHFLDLTGFLDEDALHVAGGMAHLFGGMPGNVTGAESVGIRARDGAIVPVTALMQRIDWDDLPATLLTLQPAHAVAPPSPLAGAPREPASSDAIATAPRSDEELNDLRAILETATDGVAVLDERCNVLSLNRSAEALLGFDRGVVIGKPFLSLFALPNQHLAAEYLDGLKTCANKMLLNDGRELLVKAHQGTIPVFMTLGRLGDPADETRAPRFCALFRDLTPWKKVERELQDAREEAERASALKSDFLTNVSHEIRTPVNAIIGFAEIMMEERFGPLGSVRYKEYMRDIHASGSHVMSLVNDLLDLSKIEAGKLELSRDPLDVNKIIEASVALMQPQANRERVIMRLSLAPHIPQIRADDRSLRQILINILSNAVKYNEPGGQVIVASTLTEDGHVVIRVRDTGRGMSESDVAAALEPFRRLATTRPAAGGTGLGLPLTKALVEANKAAFSIRSKVDQGTMIEVAFPPASVLANHGNA